jgi:hypothetical protein
MAAKKRKSSLARRLHRSVGAFASVFVIFMVISGIAINHSNDLGLDQQAVAQPQLLNWYGIGAPESIDSFAAGDHWISFAGSQLYFDGKAVSAISKGVGAITGNQVMIAAGSDELVLLDDEGRLIERMAWQQAGSGPIDALGVLANGGIAVRSMQTVWLSDSDLLNWKMVDDTTMKPLWSHSTTAPAAIQAAITSHYRGDKLNFEKLLLDLHSGRIFGTIGILLYDLVALAVGFLAISGMILWFRGKRNGKQKRNRNNRS